jgi:hypothetical protein
MSNARDLADGLLSEALNLLVMLLILLHDQRPDRRAYRNGCCTLRLHRLGGRDR